jgi:2-polyprenyl-6-methoxyphenol hydroxylase-like FAD-dependent oxidoreductase
VPCGWAVVRAAMFPRTAPEYAGYLLWRGTIPAERLLALDGVWEETTAVTVVFDGGRLMAYRIPTGGADTRSRTVNWALYAVTSTSASAAASPGRDAPARSRAELAQLAARHLPPYWAAMVRPTPPEQTLVQPIQDLKAPACTRGRLLLVGDAGAVARPHVGAGAVKALQEATSLEAALRHEDWWPEALARYDAERTRGGHAHVDLGRRLGREQTQHTPDWTEMDQARRQRWWHGQFDGDGGDGDGDARGSGGYALGRDPCTAPHLWSSPRSSPMY